MIDKRRSAVPPPPARSEREWRGSRSIPRPFAAIARGAKRLLDEKGADYEEYDITFGGPKRAEMLERANGRTSVPQIFIDGRHVGGSDDLYALEGEGQLDPMLAG